MKKFFAGLVVAFLPALALANPGVRFDTVLSESGATVATPSVWVGYGQDAVIEVPGKVRIVASAQAPSGERSLVKAEIFHSVDGQWVRDSAPSMHADLGKTPSFERQVQGSTYRVVIKPRAAEQP